MALVDAIERLEAGRSQAAAREAHDARTASLLGVALGVSFGICFATGMWSHLQQHPPGWVELPFGPPWTYRVTQGLHVATGLVSIPLLLAKLFSVSPQLLRRPIVRGTVDAMERLGTFALVGASVFLLFTGAANIARWYPWRFFFPVGHYWAAWIVLGAVFVHVAFKAPVARRELARRRGPSPSPEHSDGHITRRGLFGIVAASAGVLTLLTVGQTVVPLRHLALLAPRRPDVGPQGLPVNRTAAAAGTRDLVGGDYRLRVLSGAGEVASFTLGDLEAMPQVTADLPITCVEGWSADASWTGVEVAEVLAAAGLEPSAVTVRSAQTRGGYRSSELTAAAIRDGHCLLATRLGGEPLVADHGAPLRLIAPNRPGVLQTKWVVELEHHEA